jgi:hypothetical protein
MCRYHLVAALAGSESTVILTFFAVVVEGSPLVKDVVSVLKEIIVQETITNTIAQLDHTPRADGLVATLVRREPSRDRDGEIVLRVQVENT